MPNAFEPDWDEHREHEGFRARRARLGRQAGSDKTGLSLWEVPPGERAYPYHWHLAEEEIVVVLEGRPTLRSPDGRRELAPGEVVCFRVGEEGGHQLANDTEQPVRFLSFSNQAPEVVVYPDSDKVGAYERSPAGGGMRLMFRRGDAVDYYEGES
jgi:uncharacterized cupin superfamily protein